MESSQDNVEHENVEDEKRNIQNLIAKIWARARVNAFAHREAAERNKNIASRWFTAEIVASLISVLAVMAVYIASSHSKETDLLFKFRDELMLFGAIISVIASIFAMFCSVQNNYHKYDIHSSEHDFLQGQYQYIAQKTRLGKYESMLLEELRSVWRCLEQFFGILKAKGIEPSHTDFEKANKLFIERNKKNTINWMQSYHMKQPSQEDADDPCKSPSQDDNAADESSK